MEIKKLAWWGLLIAFVVGLVIGIALLTGCEKKDQVIYGKTPPAVTFVPNFNGVFTGTVSGVHSKRGAFTDAVTFTFSHGEGHPSKGPNVRGAMEGRFVSPGVAAPLVNTQRSQGLIAGHVVADSVNSPGGCYASYVFEGELGLYDNNAETIDPNVLTIRRFVGNDCQGYISQGSGVVVR